MGVITTRSLTILLALCLLVLSCNSDKSVNTNAPLPLEISQVWPGAESSSVPVGLAAVEVTFDRPIERLVSLTLTEVGGEAIPGEIDLLDQEARYLLDDRLGVDIVYEARVVYDHVNEHGRRVISQYRWTFDTHQLWSVLLDGPEPGLPGGVVELPDKGYVVAGKRNVGFETWDAFVVRTDASADVVWADLYGSPTSYQEMNDICRSTDGGFVAVGTTELDGANWDIYIIKVDSAGEVVFEETYDLGDRAIAEAVAETPDGGLFVAGRRLTLASLEWDAHLIRLDASGNVLWDSAYVVDGRQSVYDLTVTADGGCVIAGYAGMRDIVSIRDLWVAGISAEGEMLWQRSHGGDHTDEARAIVPLVDGGYVVTGWTASFGVGGEDVYVVRVDSAGGLVWERTYGGIGDEIGEGICAAHDGGFVITGRADSESIGGDGVYMLKIDDSGNLVWSHVYSQSPYYRDHGYDVIPTADGGYLVAAEHADQCWLIKTDGSGGL